MAKSGNTKQQRPPDLPAIASIAVGSSLHDAQKLNRRYHAVLAWVEKLQSVLSGKELFRAIRQLLEDQYKITACSLYTAVSPDSTETVCITDQIAADDTGDGVARDIGHYQYLTWIAQQQGAVVVDSMPGNSLHIGVPLRLHEALLGILYLDLDASADGAASPPVDLSFLDLIAGHISATLQRLLNDAQQRRDAAELGAARDHAEKASNAKSLFLSHMSHELRTPLNAILGFAQLLELNHPNPKQLKFVQEILNAGNHLLAQINQVLDLSRIEANRMEIHLEKVSLHRMTTECCDLIRPLADKKTLQINSHVEPQQAVFADSVRLKQVMLNLLSNAVKYNRPGGHIDIKVTAGDEDMIRVTVRDSGNGLNPAQCKKVFDVFERFDATSNGIEGSGIGLAIASRLVLLMGGDIGVDSTPGEGSEFWFTLRRSTAEPAPQPEEARTDSLSPQNAPTLLYVEDMPANLRLVESLIATRGDIRFISAPDGQLGLEIAQTQLPDIVLLDINLPGLHGFEVIRHLRRDPQTCHIPVVAISADGTPGNRQRAAQEGFYDFLTKPLDVQRFFSILDSLLCTLPARQSKSN